MITVEKFRETLTKELNERAQALTQNQKLQICINLSISPKSFDRYISGVVTEVRRVELAEQILNEIKQAK